MNNVFVQPCSQDLYQLRTGYGPTHIEQWISGEQHELHVLLIESPWFDIHLAYDLCVFICEYLQNINHTKFLQRLIIHRFKKPLGKGLRLSGLKK